MIDSATEADFTAFLAKYGYTVAADAGPLLALSYAFISTLPWCDSDQENHASITEAQCFIARAMSEEGGAFDPSARASGLVVKREKADSLEQEYMFNESVNQGADSLSLLKSLAIPYGLLQPFLCETATVTADTHRAAVFVI